MPNKKGLEVLETIATDISIDTIEAMPMPIETIENTSNDASMGDTHTPNDTTANQQVIYNIASVKFEIQKLEAEQPDDTDSYVVMYDTDSYIQHGDDVVLFDTKEASLEAIAKFVYENVNVALPVKVTVDTTALQAQKEADYALALEAYNVAIAEYTKAITQFEIKTSALLKKLPNGKMLQAGKQYDLYKAGNKVSSHKTELEAQNAMGLTMPVMPQLDLGETVTLTESIADTFKNLFFNVAITESNGFYNASVNGLTATNFTSRNDAIAQFINPTHSFIKNMLLSEASRVLGIEHKTALVSKPTRAKKSTEKAEPSHADKKTSDEIYNSIRENHPDGYALAKLHQSSQNWSDVLLEADSMGGRSLAYRDMLREHTRKTGIVLLDTDDSTPTELLTLATQSGKTVKLISRKSPISEQK